MPFNQLCTLISYFQIVKVYWFNERTKLLLVLSYEIFLACWPASNLLFQDLTLSAGVFALKQYDPWRGIHCRMCTSLPHSGETGVGRPSSSHAQLALLIFLVLVLFWILVYLGLLESIVWLPKLFGSLSTLAAICVWLLLWLLDIVCFLESWWTRSPCLHIVPLLLLVYQPSHCQVFQRGLWPRKILSSIPFSLDWLLVF